VEAQRGRLAHHAETSRSAGTRRAPGADQKPRSRQVTQDAIDAFAEVTGDRQWIHIDPERASGTPFGGTIAHGYYTLALAPALLADVFPLAGFAMAVNYGLDKLRFPAPLRVGDRVRLRARLDRKEPLDGGALFTAVQWRDLVRDAEVA
jgi:acyl dehydratase